MNVIILAAGMGNRLGDATRALPKTLVTVNGKPLLHYVMDFLNHSAVEEITVIGGYQFKQVEAYLKKHHPHVRCVENPDYTRGSILTIRTALPYLTKDTLIMNTDHIYPRRLMKKLLPQCRDLTAVCDGDRSLVEDDMKVLRRSDGLIADIDKKLTQHDVGYIGMTFCSAEKIPEYKAAVEAALSENGDTVAVESALRWMAKNGKPIRVADVSGVGWLEVDTQDDRSIAESKLRMSGVSKTVRAISLTIGLIFLAILIHKVGYGTIWSQIRSLGWMTLPIFAVGVGWNLLYTIAWQVFLKDHGGNIPFWALFRIKLAGEAVNTVTPANFLGGDPIRIYLLKKYYRWTAGAASVVVDRTLHAMASTLAIIIGTSLAFWRLDTIPQNIKIGLPIVLSVFIIFVAFVFLHQRRGFFSFLMELARTLHIKRSFKPETVQRAKELDIDISKFYLHNAEGFWAAFALHFGGRILGIIEIYLIAIVAYPGFTFLQAWILGAVAPIINTLFTFIPGAVGVLEGASAGTLMIMGIPGSVGITIQIVRRIRQGIWIALGFGALNIQERKH
ncbi:MAG: hypothetical protein COV45_08350 [Deltaproteobacteria bacterium CG11_big_fil_rev_8_21_14_0_20_47_16]|nr:MAG: hypothetical protein COV45_08350 [Deltaproteobacteria bacterium CG11_big_fil_rev_8_21_14_0_20_47_16]